MIYTKVQNVPKSTQVSNSYNWQGQFQCPKLLCLFSAHLEHGRSAIHTFGTDAEQFFRKIFGTALL